MTAQATVALSLSLMLGSRLTGVDMRYALWLFLASGAFSAIAWSNDAVANRERR
ncbi:hypothetical protein [Lysobacter soli]|nr:hypothetical protein [Lysobacter soli]